MPAVVRRSLESFGRAVPDVLVTAALPDVGLKSDPEPRPEGLALGEADDPGDAAEQADDGEEGEEPAGEEEVGVECGGELGEADDDLEDDDDEGDDGGGVGPAPAAESGGAVVGHLLDVPGEMVAAVDPGDEEDLEEDEPDRGKDADVDVDEIDEMKAASGEERDAEAETRKAEGEGENLSRLEILVEILPEVVLERADDHLHAAELADHPSDEEKEEEEDKPDLRGGQEGEQVAVPDQDGLNVVGHLLHLETFGRGEGAEGGEAGGA